MGIGSFIKTMTKTAGTFFNNKNGRIVGGIGAGLGIVVTAVLAYQARPKVDKIVKVAKEKIHEIEADAAKDQETKEAEIKEVTKEAAKEVTVALGPAAITGLTSIGLVAKVVASGEKAISALTEIASAGSVAYQNLDTSAKELLNDNQYEQLKGKELEKNLSNNPAYAQIDEEGFIDTGLGNIRYYDAISGRTFLCSEQAIKDAVSEVNAEYGKMPLNKRKISYEKLYGKINVKPTPATAYIYWDEPIELNMVNTIPWNQGALRVVDHMIRPKFGSPK